MTTTNAQVRTAWQNYVFGNINSGLNAFDYDYWPESRKDRSNLVYNKRVDFWLYKVNHTVELTMMRGEIQHFIVEIARVLENTPGSKSANDVIDDFVTLQGLVRNTLGDTWQSTVSFYELPADPVTPEREQFEEVEIWVGRQIYTAQNIIYT